VSSFRLLTPADPGAGYFNFSRRNIPPPSALYVAAAEGLQISAWSSINPTSFEVRGRILTAGNRLKEIRSQFVFSTGNLRQLVQTFQPLVEGFLLDLAVFPAADVIATRGQVFVSIGLARGPSSSPYLTRALCQGYLENTIALQWPGSAIQGFLDGAGFLRFVHGTSPGVASSSTETVPTGARWRLQSYFITLTTDATVGNRNVVLFALTPGALDTIFELPASAVQAPSTTVSYEWLALGGTFSAANRVVGLITQPPYFKAGEQLFLSWSGNGPADQLGAPRYYVEEWLQP
jgi:hypothetical protein